MFRNFLVWGSRIAFSAKRNSRNSGRNSGQLISNDFPKLLSWKSMKTVKVDENCIQMHHQKGQRCHRFSMSSLPILLLDAPLPMMRVWTCRIKPLSLGSNACGWWCSSKGTLEHKGHREDDCPASWNVCMFVCMYVRTYVSMYVYVCLCLCLCMSMSMSMSMPMSMPMSMYVYVYVCLCLCLCLCLCMSMYVYVYIYIYLYLCV